MDYIYCNFYYSHRKLGTPNYAFSALMELSALMSSNLIVGHAIIYLLLGIKKIEYLNYAFIFIVICIYNFFRYLYKSKHENMFVSFLNRKNKAKDNLVVLYVILSILLVISSIILMRIRIVGHL